MGDSDGPRMATSTMASRKDGTVWNTRERAHQQADGQRDGSRRAAHQQRHAGAMKQPGQDVAAHQLGAGGKAGVFAGPGEGCAHHIQRVVREQPRRAGGGGQHDQEDGGADGGRGRAQQMQRGAGNRFHVFLTRGSSRP
ncbi:hypothetical protein G6F50_015249 [Rhizopus delemar]|uniref:Uncharacterized protein n=1 Tax=Rhizopus delemar TaxID=936053 RepID=A0A9P6XZK8_9FUNG|nr:hypothetical protein G6F50_015249 [Rhizopus delemar]